MKFTVPKSTLLDALHRCVNIANPKSAMPILANVYIEANKDNPTGLLIAATDIMRSVMVDVEGAKLEAEGRICLPAKELAERIKQLPDGRVAFGVEGTKVTLKTAGTTRRFVMHGFPGAEFPSIPSPESEGAKLEVASNVLLTLISSVHFSVSTDLSRPLFASMFLEFDKSGNIRVVSTDGHRLTTRLWGSEPSGTRWLIPLQAVTDMRKLLMREPATVVLSEDENGTFFLKVDDFVYSAKLVDSDYIPWQHGVPKTFTKTVTVDRDALIESLKAVSVSSSTINGAVKFTFKKGALALEASSSTTGEGFDEIATDDMGEPSSVTITASYVLDVLQAMMGEQITIATNGPLQAPVFRPVGTEDFLALTMPIHL